MTKLELAKSLLASFSLPAGGIVLLYYIGKNALSYYEFTQWYGKSAMGVGWGMPRTFYSCSCFGCSFDWNNLVFNDFFACGHALVIGTVWGLVRHPETARQLGMALKSAVITVKKLCAVPFKLPEV